MATLMTGAVVGAQSPDPKAAASGRTKPADMESKLDNPPNGTDAMSNALKTKGVEPAEVNDFVAYLQTLKKK
jgi:hypothetical protein